jgi:hypothetical protein
MDWEHAVSTVAVVIAGFALLFNMLMDMKEDKTAQISPRQIKFRKEAPGARRWAAILTDVHILFGNVDTWLIMGTLFGSYFVWSFGDYVALFTHTIYGASVGQAATVSSAYPSGQLFGLVLGAIILLTCGRRALYVIAWCAIVSALGVVVLLLSFQGEAYTFAALAFCLGALGVQVSYVPIGVFAVTEANSGRSGAALCAGVVDGIVGVSAGSFAVYIAYIRQHWSEHSALKAVLVSCIVGLCISIPSFSAYVYRHWNGPLFSPVQQGHECDDDAEMSGSSGSTDAYRGNPDQH